MNDLMMRRPARLVLLVLLLGGGAGAHGALRCGTDLITEGDSVVKLLEACGDPATGNPDLYLDTAEWTYNFGPNEFMYRVLIRDGAVERIEELDRGVVQPFDETDTGP